MKSIDRLYEYMRYKRLKPTRFEKDLGLSNGYMGTQLKRKGGLGEDILNLIIDNCLDINPEWLLTGKGDMLKEEKSTDYKAVNEIVHIAKSSVSAYNKENNSNDRIVQLLEAQLKDKDRIIAGLEENKAMQANEITRLTAENKRLKNKEKANHKNENKANKVQKRSEPSMEFHSELHSEHEIK